MVDFGLGCRIRGLGLRAWGWEISVCDFIFWVFGGFGVWGLEIEGWGLWFEVWGSEFGVRGLRFGFLSLRSGIWGLGLGLES